MYKKWSVLVIDDDADIRQSLMDIFVFKGYSVQVALTGKSGLELVENEKINAVLIDIELPDINGIELLRIIKKKNQALVCWIITGNATREYAIEALQAGADDFFTKPLEIYQVLHKMEEAKNRALLIQQLEKTQEQYRLVIETVRSAIITVDREGNITFANPFAGVLFGYDVDSLHHVPIITLLNSSFHSGFFNLLERIFSSSSQLADEKVFNCTGLCSNGQEIFLEILTGIVRESHRHQVTLIIHDITERKENEREISRKNKELEEKGLELEKALTALQVAYSDLKNTQHQMLQQEKMASVGQLAAGVAHEINNPMGFITSNLVSLQKYFGKLCEYEAAQAALIESEDAKKQLEKIRRQMKIDFILEDLPDLFEESLEGADRVKTIVHNLKSFSRMDKAEKCMADINECLQSTLNIVWNELKYTASVHRNFGHLPKIDCYPQELNQVFMNLLVNAGQAITSQGTIRINTWEEDDSILISIADSGCGIPKEAIKRIFEPFFTTKEVGKGTGLGLSISYDIVKKHNGELLVTSEEGKGTTFTVKLPIHAAEK